MSDSFYYKVSVLLDARLLDFLLGQMAITAVVATEKVGGSIGRRIPGLALNYLLALKSLHIGRDPEPDAHRLTYNSDGPGNISENGKLHARIQKCRLELLAASSRPIITVVPGTEITAFRCFLANAHA